MASGVYNFQNTTRSRTACEQGATFRRHITLLNPDKDPIDLTGYAARMQVRNVKTGALITSLTTAGGQITIDPLAGKMILEIAAAVTETLPVGLYLYDLELTIGSDVTRVIEGKFQVSRNMTL